MMNPVVRLGALSFLNAYPFRLSPSDLAEVSPSGELHVRYGTPSELNTAIADGQLDVSLVSSAFYLRHQTSLAPLADLAIGSKGPTESVYLAFPSNIPAVIDRIAVPQTSETSVALAACWLAHHTGQRPSPQTWPIYPQGQSTAWLAQGIPTLLIGDEALSVRLSEAAQEMQVIDLGQWWFETTSTPFVFALWVAQADFARTHPQAVQAIQTQLQRKKTAFLGDLRQQATVLVQAAQDFPDWPKAEIQRYLAQVLSYDLGPSEQAGLSQFSEFLTRLDASSCERVLQRLP